ncbi:hypothetical protein LC612_42335 [Nostoc sp. CHAB 5834]|nr:hypothetical protein [Nostoc sp. CHAB 5834]
MHVQMIDGALVVDLGQKKSEELAPKDFEKTEVTVHHEPAFYVALGSNGLMERNVSVTLEDRKTVAALVGNWIAQGYQPIPVDAKTFAKHVRNLVAANKPAKSTEPGAEASPGPSVEPGGEATV